VTRAASARAVARPKTRRADWVPQRQEVIWINCNPQAGRDMHPFLVLSPVEFNAATSLVIGLPMTTAAYNADNPFAIAVGMAAGKKAGKTSYVLCHQPKSFDWRHRDASPHPLGRLPDAPFSQACAVLDQIVQIAGAKA
jgi:mRNA interferase MazF